MAMLPACTPKKPDALSAKDKAVYCQQLITYVEQHKDATDKLEENLSSRFHMKSEFASRAYWIYGYINSKGQIAIMPEFMQAESFSEGLARATRIGEKLGFIDTTGRTVISGFTNAHPYTYDLAPVEIQPEGPWGFMDRSGKTVIKPQYDIAWGFQSARARVQKNGLWGYIDIKGTLAVPMVYDSAEDYGSDNNAVVRHDKTWYVIDLYGNQVGHPYHKRPSETVHRHGEKPNGYSDLVPFTQNNKVGYKDQSGNEVIPAQFDSGDYFSQGLAQVGYVCVPPKK